MNEILKVTNLTKKLNQKEVLKNINMTIKKGEIYGLLGENGAGKTTTFKLIAGLMKPTCGEISFDGKNITSGDKAFLKRMGLLIEIPVFYEHLSAKENLEIHLSYMGCSTTNIDQMLFLVGLNKTGKQPVSQFSLGMKQRLAIARIISHSPELLLLDEPINGLDPKGIRQMRELFLSLVKDYGMTIIMSSHILSEIEHIADNVLVLADGIIKKEVSISDIKKISPNGLEDYFFEIMSGGKD